MKNETLWWTIGGVAIALLALFAMTRNSGGSSSSGGTSSGGGISANALVSEVNTVNQTAAAVEADRINAMTTYAVHGSDNQVSVFADLVNAAENQFATVEGAQTSRYVSDNATKLGEYTASENALTAQAALAEEQSVSLAQTKAYENIAHFTSDNAVTVARIQHGSSFGNFMQSLLGAASSFFGSPTGAKVLGAG